MLSPAPRKHNHFPSGKTIHGNAKWHCVNKDADKLTEEDNLSANISTNTQTHTQYKINLHTGHHFQYIKMRLLHDARYPKRFAFQERQNESE